VYKAKKTIVIAPAFNEGAKIGRVVQRCRKLPWLDTILVVNDCSTDNTRAIAEAHGAHVLTLDERLGVGAALRAGLEYARTTRHDLAVIIAGNDKDEPREIPDLLDPICNSDFDFVVGSRFAPGGAYGGDMPFYRKLATRVHPWLVSLFVGRRITESTNGFRAFKLSLLDDPRIRLNQPWLDMYGLEVYLLWKALVLGYRHTEVPCTKIYPPKSVGYTKMKPVTGWWNILRPIFLLGLRLRG
jgi:dolichol-phosphate mannosyltransferase